MVPNALYPAASGTGGTRTLRVTFPDGSRAELTYPAGLNLASLGARPYTSATLSGGGTAEARPARGGLPSGTPVVDPRHTIAGSACRAGFYLAASGDDAFVRSALKDVRARAL